MTAPLEPPRYPGRRPRKGWDIALTIVFLVGVAPLAFCCVLLAVTSLVFLDNCPHPCNLLSSITVDLGLFAAAVAFAGTIASIVLLAVRRRAWWVALATFAAILIPVIVFVVPALVGTLVL